MPPSAQGNSKALLGCDVPAAPKTGCTVRSGDLRRDHKALEIGCLNCDRHEYVDANSVKLPDNYRKTGKNEPEQISIVRHKGMI